MEKINVNSIIEGAETIAIRREGLCEKPPRCPECHTTQVQLVDWRETVTAGWKCRNCKQKFRFELGVVNE